MTRRYGFALLTAVLLLGCREVPTTQTGVPERAPADPGTPDPVTYSVVLLEADTAVHEGDFTLTQHVLVLTRDGRRVAVAEVDFSATEGRVLPATTTMGPDGTATVQWMIPSEIRLANLLACARPPANSCRRGPILKWNR